MISQGGLPCLWWLRLEGAVNVESDLDYFFSNPSLPNMRAGVENQEVHIVAASSLFPSILSGPR